MLYVAYKELESKKPFVEVLDHDPEIVVDNEWSVIKVQFEEDLYDLPGKLQVLLYNRATDSNIVKFSDKKEGARRTFLVLPKLVSSETSTKKGTTMAKAAKKEPKTSKRADVLEKTIQPLVDENPCRQKSAVYDRFQLFFKNPTVGKYLEKGGSMGDVKFFEKKKFIKLV